jgi:ribonuclease D
MPSEHPPHLIVDPSEFAVVLDRLQREALVAVDTEAASFHRHRDRVYLLQLSSRADTHLVDPVAVAGLPGLGALLANPDVECVFHDADYDLRLLGREFGFAASRLFDTRVAAQFLNEPGIGLAALLEKYLGVRPDKRFQRADWSQRPLTPPMLNYAAMDTQYLPALRDVLRAKLEAMGRLAWVAEECALLTKVRWPAPTPPEVAALTVKGARALSPGALAIFRELYVWREQAAESLDRAAFRIMGYEPMLALAERPPADLAALAGVSGVGREVVERRGNEVLAAIRRGKELPEAELPRYPRSERRRADPAFEGRMERLKAVRARLVAALDLQPGVIAPNWLLEAIARAAPRTTVELGAMDGIRRWQLNEFGEQLILAIS